MKSPTPLSRISAIPPPSPCNTVCNTPPLPLQYQYRQQGDRSAEITEISKIQLKFSNRETFPEIQITNLGIPIGL